MHIYQVTETDSLPLKMCIQCVTTVLTFSSLAISCTETNNRFEEMMLTSDVFEVQPKAFGDDVIVNDGDEQDQIDDEVLQEVVLSSGNSDVEMHQNEADAEEENYVIEYLWNEVQFFIIFLLFFLLKLFFCRCHQPLVRKKVERNRLDRLKTPNQ